MAGDALFTPLRLGGALELPNRLAVAPMTRVSATEPGPAHTNFGVAKTLAGAPI